ncbi:MAG: uridine phosphorylase [Thermodesulfobacteriota bacterium]
MKKVYHLDLTKNDLGGASVALLPGDPARTAKIAERVASAYKGTSSLVASKREFTTYLSYMGTRPVVVTSTGIGGPSTSIAVEELARLGVKTFIRVGTTGAIQESIRVGDSVITTASVRLDGASTHYAPIEYPAVSSYRVLKALVKGAKAAKVTFHTGVTASSDTFYQGEERTDSFRKYTIKRFKGSTEEWRRLNVLNYEMESATLLTVTASMALEGGCITGVINRCGGGAIKAGALKKGEDNVIKAAVAALKFL